MKKENIEIKEEDVKHLMFCKKCGKHEMKMPLKFVYSIDGQLRYGLICSKCGTKSPYDFPLITVINKFFVFLLTAWLIIGAICFIFFYDINWIISLSIIQIICLVSMVLFSIFLLWYILKDIMKHQKMKAYADRNYQKPVGK